MSAPRFILYMSKNSGRYTIVETTADDLEVYNNNCNNNRAFTGVIISSREAYRVGSKSDNWHMDCTKGYHIYICNTLEDLVTEHILDLL